MQLAQHRRASRCAARPVGWLVGRSVGSTFVGEWRPMESIRVQNIQDMQNMDGDNGMVKECGGGVV